MVSLRSVDGTMAGAAVTAERWRVVAFADSCLRGMGQICFMNNPVSGGLILLALTIWSPWLGLSAAVGLAVATAAASAFGVDRTLVRGGLLGFNGALVGAAFATFLVPAWHIGVLGYLVGAAVCSTVVMVAVARMLAGWGVPALTIPFNLVALTWFALAVRLPRGQAGSLLEPRDVDAAVEAGGYGFGELVGAPFRGISQLFLADSVWVGIVILVAMAVCSRLAALLALLGSVIGEVTGIVVGAPHDAVVHGLWGYNGYVTAVAIGGMFLVPGVRTIVLAAVAAVMASVGYAALTTVLAPWGLPALTLPFCLATVGALVFGAGTWPRSVVPLETVTTPEQHRRITPEPAP